MREAALGRVNSPEARRKMSAAHLGVALSNEHRRRIGEGSRGRRHTIQAKQRIGAASRGRKHPHTQEARQKIGDAFRGRTLTEHHREKVSAALAGHPFNESRIGGDCALCGKAARLVRDHDHVTGLHRGLICNNCNTGLGLLGDSLVSLRRAVAYLERSTSHVAA
jgi:hypothetical protein